MGAEGARGRQDRGARVLLGFGCFRIREVCSRGGSQLGLPALPAGHGSRTSPIPFPGAPGQGIWDELWQEPAGACAASTLSGNHKPITLHPITSLLLGPRENKPRHPGTHGTAPSPPGSPQPGLGAPGGQREPRGGHHRLPARSGSPCPRWLPTPFYETTGSSSCGARLQQSCRGARLGKGPVPQSSCQKCWLVPGPGPHLTETAP